MDRWIDFLLIFYPAGFRARFGLASAVPDGIARRRAEGRPVGAAWFVARASIDAIASGVAERLYARRQAWGNLGRGRGAPRESGRTLRSS